MAQQCVVVLQVLETCVKNCGHRFHSLVTSRDFIDGVLVKIIAPKNNPPTIVQDKVLALIQVCWWTLPAQHLITSSSIDLVLETPAVS